LLGAFPAHRSTIKAKYKSRLRFEVILVSLEASVGVTTYNELLLTSIDKKLILSSSKVFKDILSCNPVSLS